MSVIIYNSSNNEEHIESRLNKILALIQENQIDKAYKQYHAEKPNIWSFFLQVLKSASVGDPYLNHLSKDIDNLYTAFVRCLDSAVKTDVGKRYRNYFASELIMLGYHYLSYCYFMNRYPLPGTWACLHKVYFDSLDSQNQYVNELHTKYYKKCIMLALYHPYDIDKEIYRELYKINDELIKYIEIEKATTKQRHNFYIDVCSDNPLSEFKNLEGQGGNLLAIDTTELKAFLNNKIAKKKNYIFNRDYNLINISLNSANFLFYIVANQKIRQYRRNQANSTCSISLNFSETWHNLHDGNTTKQAAAIINKSDGGLCLEVDTVEKENYQAGHIIGVHESLGSDFLIGMIKWVKVAGNKILVGIEKLAINPKAIKANIDSLNFSDALSFTFSSNKLSLLTPLYPFKSGQMVSVKTEDSSQYSRYLLGKEYSIGKFKIFELV